LFVVAVLWLLLRLRMKNTATAIRARPATPPTAPPTMAPIGVPDEETGAGTALLVEPWAAVVGEPLPPVLWPPAEFWPPEPAVLEDCEGDAEAVDDNCVNGIPEPPEVGRLEVSVTVIGEKTRPSLSPLEVV
jgi:hypothetical protein